MKDTVLVSFSTEALKAELRRREEANNAGLCDACGEWYDSASCGSDRHKAASKQWYKRWRLGHSGSFLVANSENQKLIISSYRVTLYKNDEVRETELPSDVMSDEERFRWAIDWAEGLQ